MKPLMQIIVASKYYKTRLLSLRWFSVNASKTLLLIVQLVSGCQLLNRTK